MRRPFPRPASPRPACRRGRGRSGRWPVRCRFASRLGNRRLRRRGRSLRRRPGSSLRARHPRRVCGGWSVVGDAHRLRALTGRRPRAGRLAALGVTRCAGLLAQCLARMLEQRLRDRLGEDRAHLGPSLDPRLGDQPLGLAGGQLVDRRSKRLEGCVTLAHWAFPRGLVRPRAPRAARLSRAARLRAPSFPARRSPHRYRRPAAPGTRSSTRPRAAP